jgi:arylsulfatase
MKRNKLASSIFMVTPICAAMALVTNPSYAATNDASDEEKQPNIVLMMADNLGYGDLGVYGGGENRGMPTPNIDQLASEGLRFDQFLVEYSCAPTRAATLTGRYSIRSLDGGRGMQQSEITLAKVLKDVGYATAAYGKWHLGWDDTKGQQPQQRGFDEFYGVQDAAGKILYPSTMREQGIEPDEEVQLYVYQFNKRTGQMEKVMPYNKITRRIIDERLVQKAVAFIQNNKDNPFFLYIPWTRVHYPNYPHPKFKDKSRIGMYGDSVMELDANTGKVLEAIEENGIEENTIVIWMSDNGPMRTAVWPDGGFQGPYRGDIGSAREGSIRTAGMIKWPGHIEPGVMYEMLSCMDFFPTLAKFADAERKIPTGRPIDGIDQSDFLLNYSTMTSQEKQTPPRDHLLTFINGMLTAVRWKQFRIYFTSLLPQEGFMAIEGSSSMNVPTLNPLIYNIEADPREVVDTRIYNGWAMSKAGRYVTEYVESLEKDPNPTTIQPSLLPQEIFFKGYFDKAKLGK